MMEYIILAAVIAGFAIVLGRMLFVYYRESALRRYARAKDVTFSCVLSRVKIAVPGGWPNWESISSPIILYIRDDSIEISSSWPIFRLAMGLEYLFRAHETSIEVSKEPSIRSKEDWIIVTGTKLGREFRVAICRKEIFGGLYPIWNALIKAGVATTGGPPPKVVVPDCNSG